MAAKHAAPGSGVRGYAMAALLVAIAALAVFASVAMPVWRTVVQREKEEELVFRGQQYVRAIRLFQRKFANAYPPTVDLLVEQRFLRKKYKDPITNGDFVLLYQGMFQQGPAAQPGAARQPVSGRAGTITNPAVSPGMPLANQQAAGPRGGIVGVASKSTGDTIRIYNGRSKYNEWQFVYVQTGGPAQGGAQTPGGRGQGGVQPGMGRGRGGPGGQGMGPGGRGFGGGRGGPGGSPPLP
jgi:type II secretory pathway pseudopilin PulG